MFYRDSYPKLFYFLVDGLIQFISFFGFEFYGDVGEEVVTLNIYFLFTQTEEIGVAEGARWEV